MFTFLKIQFELGKVTEAQLDFFVSKGFIDSEQKSEIIGE